MEESTSDWSALPQDLLARIGTCLRTIDYCIFDNLRFRAVCTCWRFSLPPFPPSPLTLPFPLVPGQYWDTGHFTLKETTLYHLKSLHLYQQENHPNCGGFFLLIVGEQQHPPDQLRLITPLDRSSSSYWWDDQTKTFTYPKEINLLDFQISKICKSHTVQSFDNYETERLESPWHDSNPHIGKVVFLHHINHSHDNPSYSMLATRDHTLFFMQHGDDQWTVIGNNWRDYITYNGKFYLVAQDGSAMTINSSGNLKVITPPILDYNPDHGRQFNMLMLVIESLRGDLLLYYHYHTDFFNDQGKMAFKLYRLDEEDQHMWVEMTTLGGDQLLLVDNDKHGLSFSLLTRDFPALLCKGNCIYEACLYSKPDEFPKVMVSNFDHGDATHMMHGHPLWSSKELYPCTEFTSDNCDTCDDNEIRDDQNIVQRGKCKYGHGPATLDFE